ncbi:Ig-like domain-containing protein [Paenibacillus koleovorans]|uniref:Ig-like domain-containing protein n=1 Tax=Paenibacillus koleovorans TaxID=121608 RepID=UPI000FDA891D|nr:Ig-like domain-containing protein [Paenibacillus koleovorans]
MNRFRLLMMVLIFALVASPSITPGTAQAADEISKLILNKNELALQVGETASLTATAVYLSGATENATIKTDWNSSNSEIASVYAGVVTAKREGKAVLTATYMGKMVVVNVDVSKKIKSLTIDKSSMDLRLNASEQVTITAYYDDGTTEDVTKKADYTAASSSIVTVTNGLVKGQRPGSTRVTVKYMNQTLTLDIDVEVVRRIDTEQSKVSLFKNGTAPIKVWATYPDGTVADVSELIEWTTDNAQVADAIKGFVTGYGVGTATLTGSYGTKSTTVLVDVDSTLKLELDKPGLLMKRNTSGELKLTATYTNGETEDISDRAEWTSSDTNIVEVSKGRLHATAIGEAVITAKYGAKTVQASVDVEVPRRLVVSSDLLSLQTGQVQQLVLSAYYADGTSGNVGGDAVWRVDHEDIALVHKGKVTSYKAGVATVTAEYGGKKTTTRVEVDVPAIIKAGKKIVNLQIGDSSKVTLEAQFKDGRKSDITAKAEWTSSNGDIADVREGSITGISTGAATIKAEFGTRTAVIQVSVGVLKSLTVSKDKLDLRKGDAVTLQAEALYMDETEKDVTMEVIWTSANSKVASVDGGKVKAVGPGDTTLSAQFDNKTVTIPVQVDRADELTASSQHLVFDLYDTRAIQLTAANASGAIQDVTKEAEWKTSNSAIAMVTKGVVTPVSRGKATITASYGGKSVTILVEIGVVQSLAADKTYIVMKSGEQVQIRLSATLADGSVREVSDEAIWKVSSYKLGTISGGLFTATGSGKTTITATFGGKSVSVPVEIDSLKYLKTDVVKLTLQEGKTAKVEAIATYSDGVDENVTLPALWTSSNIMVADVKDGLIKATGKGTARITVTFANKKTTVQVTVKPEAAD